MSYKKLLTFNPNLVDHTFSIKYKYTRFNLTLNHNLDVTGTGILIAIVVLPNTGDVEILF